MNIDEYIKKCIEINQEGNEINVYMSVPPVKVVIYKWQEDEDTKPKIVNGSDIEKYLNKNGYKDITITFSQVINNAHPNGLNARWTFKTSTSPRKRKTKTTKEK